MGLNISKSKEVPLRRSWGKRLDTAARYLFRSVELGEKSVALGERNIEIGEKMLEMQKRTLEKQDQMLKKQDQTIKAIEKLDMNMNQKNLIHWMTNMESIQKPCKSL